MTLISWSMSPGGSTRVRPRGHASRRSNGSSLRRQALSSGRSRCVLKFASGLSAVDIFMAGEVWPLYLFHLSSHLPADKVPASQLQGSISG